MRLMRWESAKVKYEAHGLSPFMNPVILGVPSIWALDPFELWALSEFREWAGQNPNSTVPKPSKLGLAVNYIVSEDIRRKSIGCTDRFPAAQMCFARPCIKSVCIPSSRRRKAKSLKQKQSFRYVRLRHCHRCTMLKSHVAPFCAKWFKVIVLNVWTPGRYACSSSVWFWPFQWPSECQQDCKGPGLNICGLQDFEPLVKFSSYLQASILFPFEGPQAEIHRGRKCSICQRHLTPDSLLILIFDFLLG